MLPAEFYLHYSCPAVPFMTISVFSVDEQDYFS